MSTDLVPSVAVKWRKPLRASNMTSKPFIPYSVAISALALLFPIAVAAGPADPYLQDAHKREQQNDVRGALIQLRNAAQAEPTNGNIHLELARVYLRLGNPNSAEAELFAAHLRGVKDEVSAPLMA